MQQLITSFFQPNFVGLDSRDRSNGNNGSGLVTGAADAVDRRDQRKGSRSIHSPDLQLQQPPAKRLREHESLASGRTLSTSSAGDVKGGDAGGDEARSILVSESVTCLSELVKCCPPAWTGGLILKNSAFPCKMLLCSGDVSLVDLLMKSADQPPVLTSPSSGSSGPAGDVAGQTGSAPGMPVLRITQRLRLDPPKLEDVQRRLNAAGSQGQCTLLVTRAPTSASSGSTTAVLGEDGNGVVQRPLKNLVHYLKQKQAAGVIPLTSSPHPSSIAAATTATSAASASAPASTSSAAAAAATATAGTGVPAAAVPSSGKEVRGSLYAFPPCPFASDLIRKIAPNFADCETSPKEDYLLVLLIRGSK